MNKLPMPLLCLRKGPKMKTIQFEIDTTSDRTQKGEFNSQYDCCIQVLALQQNRKEPNTSQQNHGNIVPKALSQEHANKRNTLFFKGMFSLLRYDFCTVKWTFIFVQLGKISLRYET